MTIFEVLQEARQKAAARDENVLSIEVLLANVLNVDRAHLFAHQDKKLNNNEIQLFAALFNRFCRGEPVAYLTGVKEFYGMNMLVNESVLIPRPETEMLVDKVIEFVRSNSKELRILDVGTGSGAIAVALAKNLDYVNVVATDVSEDVLKVARKNARLHKVADRVDFIKADLLDGVEGVFDVVVANLPYIGEKKFNFVSKEVHEYEPHVALYGGNDGLELYRKLFKQLAQKDWKPYLLLGEFGFLQADEMLLLLKKHFGGQKWSIEKDYASIERIFVVKS